MKLIMEKRKLSYQELESEISNLKKEIETLRSSYESDKISDAKYSKMIGNIGDVIVIVDHKGLNRYKSPNIEKYFGWKPEDVIGKNTFENVHPEDLELVHRFVENLSKEPNKVETIELRYKCKNGIYKWIEFTCSNLLNDPEINGLLGNYHDITESKLAREALLKSEEHLKETAYTAKVGGWEYDLVNNILSWSEETFRIHEIEGDQVPDVLTAIKYYHPEDQKMVSDLVNCAIQNGEEYDFEARVITAKNNLKWIRSIGTVDLVQGKVVRLKGMIQDITDRKKVEQALKESENLYKSLFQNLNVPLSLYEIINDDNGEPCDYRFLAVNSNYEKTVGLKGPELVGKTLLEVFPGTESSWLDVIKDVCKTGIPITVENYAKEVDLYVELTVYLPQDGQMAFICPDITARKKAELKLVDNQALLKKQNEEFLVINEELKERNNEYALLNEELTAAKEKAEESDRLKTEFINNMSHEIRTPMNGIMGFSDLLDSPDLSFEKRKYYTRIVQNSSKQLLRIIDDILEISTLETKQVKVESMVFCLNDLLLDLFSIFNLRAQEKKLPFYLKKGLTDYESTIVSDKTKLSKILSNLIENALKYTNTGFIELGYSVKNNNIEIYLKDTGIGISKKNQNRIFERFSQEERDFSANKGGLGLGLSIAKENAELIGGTVTLESEKGKGSTFFVSIPYKPEISVIDVPNRNSSKEHHGEQQKQHSILIAEDQEVNFLYIEAVLDQIKDIPIRVVHAKNGKEALELCSKNDQIILVLMDIKMPVMNGLVATEEIKKIRPELHIVAQTAYSTESDKLKAFNAGCNDFITKPIDKDKLLRLVNQYVKPL